MKLLFVENRYKTLLLEAVAESLSAEHEIYWIVQNSSFTPSSGNTHVIPYPSKKKLQNIEIDYDINYDKIIQSDRQVNFFKKQDKNYFYYYANEIASTLLKVQPDFIFGEATAFHELITIELSKKFKIQYLNPTTCRYPTGRFSFYNYESLEPYMGSNEVLEREEVLKQVASINDRSIKPDYMKKVSISKNKNLKDKLKIITSYYNGEKYNTPPPIVKLKLERLKNQSIKKWYTFAKSSIDTSKTSILFPMHMQPESNIDVWGRLYRDQFKTIKNIHKSLLEGQILYVKPNPKSKYELSNELIDYIQSHENIVALRHDLPMSEIFNDVNLVTTITGTIAIECILANKPVVTFVKTINNTASNCLFTDNYKTLTEYFKMIESNSFPQIEEEEKLSFFNTLNKLSFKGIIADPYNNPNSTSKENIENIKHAFNVVISNEQASFI